MNVTGRLAQGWTVVEMTVGRKEMHLSESVKLFRFIYMGDRLGLCRNNGKRKEGR